MGVRVLVEAEACESPVAVTVTTSVLAATVASRPVPVAGGAAPAPADAEPAAPPRTPADAGVGPACVSSPAFAVSAPNGSAIASPPSPPMLMTTRRRPPVLRGKDIADSHPTHYTKGCALPVTNNHCQLKDGNLPVFSCSVWKGSSFRPF